MGIAAKLEKHASSAQKENKKTDSMERAKIRKDMNGWRDGRKDFQNKRARIKCADDERKSDEEKGDWNTIFVVGEQKITKNDDKAAGKREPIEEKK